MKRKRFLAVACAADDPQLAARLDIARQHYIREVMLLAEEAGVLLTMEDFLDEAVSLSDDSMESVSGGFSPSPWGHYCTPHGCK